MKIRAMIIDGTEISRRKLSEILESDHSIEVVCKLGDEEGAAEMVGWISPDVVLIKVDMCKKGGFELFDSVLKKKIPVIVIGNGKDRCDELIDLLEKGAVDFLAWPKNKDVIKKVKN
ncbi:MAG: response regulator, partial [Candidatus Hydrothermarchaeales archaeon]